MEKSWKEAIKKVLAESESPLHYTEISEQILSRGYYETEGATPAATVSAQLTSSIKHDGDKSPFIRVGKGIFALRIAPIEAIISASPPTSKQLETLAESDVMSTCSPKLVAFEFGVRSNFDRRSDDEEAIHGSTDHWVPAGS
jgi:hypothetical protein